MMIQSDFHNFQRDWTHQLVIYEIVLDDPSAVNNM